MKANKRGQEQGESKALEERMVTALETYVDLRMEMEKIRMLNECGDCR